MKKESIRQDRLRSGAPLLVGHDTADQVGVVESFEITADKKLRILARFGRSDRAEEIFRDVLDGIRKNASVGYIIHDLVLEKQEEDVATYRVTDWEPLEGSIVAVPADPRSASAASSRTLAPPTPTQGDSMTPEEEKNRGARRDRRRERAKPSRKRATRPSAPANTPRGDRQARAGAREPPSSKAGTEFKDARARRRARQGPEAPRSRPSRRACSRSSAARRSRSPPRRRAHYGEARACATSTAR
jgi:hypothetical protein